MILKSIRTNSNLNLDLVVRSEASSLSSPLIEENPYLSVTLSGIYALTYRDW